MSTIDDATVIANLRETVERLIRERDAWMRKADLYKRLSESLRTQLKQKGDPQ